MKCFYHKSDLDGHCSGAIIKAVYPECEMIGVDYNDKLSEYLIEPDETVYVVDFSFSVEEMAELDVKTHLFWIDHHKSAIEKMADYPRKICGIREIGKAGCELTWEFMHPGVKMPEAVWLLGRYDVWKHKEDENIMPFQYGMRHYDDTLPESVIWVEYLREDALLISQTITKGKTILKYQDQENAKYAKGMAYEAVFCGLRAIVINKAYSNSKIFDSVYDSKRHDIMVLFGVKPGEFKYSLYSDKENVDVSLIAIKYGGGGHAGAAGFYSKEQVV